MFGIYMASDTASRLSEPDCCLMLGPQAPATRLFLASLFKAAAPHR